MKTSKTIRLVGTITAVEPVGTTFPKSTADSIPDNDDRKRVDGYLQNGTMPINRDGVIAEEPIISGTAIKSKLRHACSDAITFKRAADGNKVSMKDLYLMKVGQNADAKSNKEKLEDGESTLIDCSQLHVYRDANSVADQFGIFEMGGNLAMSAAIGVDRIRLEFMGGVRHDIPVDYINDYAAGNAKEEYMERRLNNTKLSHAKTELSLKERELRKVRIDAKLKKGVETAETNALNAQIVTLAETIKELGALQGDTKISTQMPIPVRHVAAAGSVFKQTITIADGSARGLSMVAFGLKQLSKNPKIGAYKSSCGEIKASWDVIEIIDGVADTKGTLSIGGFVNSVFVAVDAQAQAWWDANSTDTTWIK